MKVYIDNSSSDKVYFDEFIIERTEAAVAVVVQENHYYPFGMNMKGIEELDSQSLDGNDEHRFQYNGKEKEESFGLYWNDHGAKSLDVQLVRWNGVDPLAEKFVSTSSYVAMLNNPILFIDPDGREVINGDEVARNQAQKARDEAKTEFNENYTSTDLKSKDFASKSDWKSYKSARNNLKSQQKALDKAQANYEHTQQSIDHFAAVDPEGFAKANNLTYTNNAGETRTVDIVVKTGDTGEFGKGKTAFSVTRAGNIRDNAVETTLDLNVSPKADVLAHEFGHAVALASDPIGYAAAVVPNHNCQDPANRNHVLSKTPLDWQEKYNRLHKIYKKKNK